MQSETFINKKLTHLSRFHLMDSVGVKSETGLTFDVDDFTHLPTLKKHRYKNLYNFWTDPDPT